ncbi:MAG: ring-cleaving dioxygenase [Acetobacteraceae bacterium]|nr:ring-cleaving dioxygenase [Acetobacteraceae bacterium]
MTATYPIGRLHHVTAIASDPARNVAFYEGLLGLRLIKQTVNYDDPSVHHLYYGDFAGSPGAIMTFFPYAGAKPGRHGVGQAEETAFAVPPGSLGFWRDRLAANGVAFGDEARFGQALLAFKDHDGLRLEIVESPDAAGIEGRAAEGVPAGHAIRGFAGVTLWLKDVAGTASVLTDVLGYEQTAAEGSYTRFVHPGPGLGRVVDLRAAGGFWAGAMGAGVVHHVAFRAASDAAQEESSRALRAKGLGVTPQQDRNYFRSTYFREPGGVLFEVATDDPGFAIDETPEQLGGKLMLPPRYEPHRAEIEASLPKLRGTALAA